MLAAVPNLFHPTGKNTARQRRVHDGALDPQVMRCDVSVPRCKALDLSSEGHLPANACWRATPRWARQSQHLPGERTKQDARRKSGTSRAHELGL